MLMINDNNSHKVYIKTAKLHVMILYIFSRNNTILNSN